MSKIKYTRASSSPIEGLTLEVGLEHDVILTIARLENDWKLLMNSSNPNQTKPVQISWQEFLEIVHEVQKFVAIENEVLIAGEDE